MAITAPHADANITEIHASLPANKEKGKNIHLFDAQKMTRETLIKMIDTSKAKLDSITDKINQIIKNAEVKWCNLFDGTADDDATTLTITLPPMYDNGSFDQKAFDSITNQTIKTGTQHGLINLYRERMAIYDEKIKECKSTLDINIDLDVLHEYSDKLKEYINLYNADIHQIWKICSKCNPNNSK
jgi:hypothetical protein